MELDGYYGGDNLQNYVLLVEQLPKNLKNNVIQAIGMAKLFEHQICVTHLGTTRRVILNIYGENNEVIEFSVWISSGYNDIDNSQLHHQYSKGHKLIRKNYNEDKYGREKIFEMFREVASGTL